MVVFGLKMKSLSPSSQRLSLKELVSSKLMRRVEAARMGSDLSQESNSFRRTRTHSSGSTSTRTSSSTSSLIRGFTNDTTLDIFELSLQSLTNPQSGNKLFPAFENSILLLSESLLESLLFEVCDSLNTRKMLADQYPSETLRYERT